MVASASSSKHQWPSGCWASSSARVADAMLFVERSRGPSAVMRAPVDEFGVGAVARADRAFERRRQSGRGPVAGQKQVLPLGARAGTLGVLGGCRGEGRAPLAHDLPRRQVRGNSRDLGDLVPDRLRQLGARHVHQPVGAADRHRQPAFERKNPLGRAVDAAPLHRRHAGRHVDLEMRVGDRSGSPAAPSSRAPAPPRHGSAPRGSPRRRRRDRPVSPSEIELRRPARRRSAARATRAPAAPRRRAPSDASAPAR